MRIRHRVPMVFSLSMLDVFCCALGCVTLLWLINQREAMLRAKTNSNITSTLEVTRSDLKALREKLAVTSAERDRLSKSAAQLREELEVANESADKLTKDLATLRRRAEDTQTRLSKAMGDLQTLTRERNAARERAADLAERLHDEEAKVVAADRQATDLTARIRDADAELSTLRSTAELVPGLRQASASANEKLSAISKESESARRSAAAWEGERRDLTNRITRAQAAIENRFEGIAITGKRVVFLVDMSGSMEMVDEKTSAPHKWTGVRDSLVKIFKSLPDLEKYQIILFSDQLQYLLGNDGLWLDRDAKSAERIQTTLAGIKPKGNTNMYIAMEAAFRLRSQGLDTIYLLSDGLPNIGEGLTADQANRMTESQRSEVLSRFIRNILKTNWNAPLATRPRVRINSIGFFYESPEVGAFLWALSRENEGSFVGMSKP